MRRTSERSDRASPRQAAAAQKRVAAPAPPGVMCNNTMNRIYQPYYAITSSKWQRFSQMFSANTQANVHSEAVTVSKTAKRPVRGAAGVCFKSRTASVFGAASAQARACPQCRTAPFAHKRPFPPQANPPRDLAAPPSLPPAPKAPSD